MAGIDPIARNRVTPDQSVSHVQIGSQPELDDVDVELFAGWEVAQLGACFEEEGEGVFAGEDSVAAHGEVDRERVECVGLGADEGVPHEGVGVGCGMEDS